MGDDPFEPVCVVEVLGKDSYFVLVLVSARAGDLKTFFQPQTLSCSKQFEDANTTSPTLVNRPSTPSRS